MSFGDDTLDPVNERDENASGDMLREAFLRQQSFMEMLRESDLLPEWPVDLRTKPGQRLVKETIFNVIGEIMEASFILKNKVHRLTDDRTLDIDHYKEEIGDAFAFLLEVCILSGIDATELFDEYCRKNQVVKQRLREGY